jgi:hypothetical protein
MERSVGEFYCREEWLSWCCARHVGYDFRGEPILLRRRRIAGIELGRFIAELGERRLGSEDSKKRGDLEIHIELKCIEES